jgi:hypothetical protein
MADLTDNEVRSAIVYMFNYGVPLAEAPVAPARSATNDPRHKVVDGTDVYLGLMRADAMRAMGAAAMNAPSGKGYYHLNISLADNKTQAPVREARVRVHVTDGMSTETKELSKIVANGLVSYGAYFHLSSGSAYSASAEIWRPGVASPVEAKFEFSVP